LRVLLVQSYHGKVLPPIHPLGLSYIAASLKGHVTKILNLNLYNDPFQTLEETLQEFKPDVIGLSIRNIGGQDLLATKIMTDLGMYCNDFLDRALNIIHNSCKDSKVVIGGPAFSLYPLDFMRSNPRADFGIYLEGEESFNELLENLDTPSNVKGVYYRKNGEVFFTGHRDFPDVSKLDLPQRNLAEINQYREIPFSIGVLSKRGCILKCAYCTYKFFNGQTIRLREPHAVVDEIESLVNKYGIKSFAFADSVFNVPISHAKNICHLMVERGLDVEWSAFFNEKFLDEESLSLFLDAGCKFFEFSPDGYSDKNLKALQKNITNKDIKKTYKLAKKYPEMNVSYNFFVDTPETDSWQFFKLLWFKLRAKIVLGKRLKFFSLGYIHIDPHTEIYDMAVKMGTMGQPFLPESLRDINSHEFFHNPSFSFTNKLYLVLLRVKFVMRKLVPGFSHKTP
jgi:hypothetical protein